MTAIAIFALPFAAQAAGARVSGPAISPPIIFASTRAIGPDMRLRFLLLVGLFFALPAFAQLPADVLATLTDAAAALANDDPPAFLDQFDRAMPGFADLRANVEGLLGASQVTSTIEPVSNQGDDRQY